MKNIVFTSLVLLRNGIYKSCLMLDKVQKKRTDVFVLSYHAFSNDTWRFSVSPTEFKKQIEHLKKEGYQFITLSDLIAYMQGGKTFAKPSVLLTIDDGYKNVLTVKECINKEKIKPLLFALAVPEKVNRKEVANTLPFLDTAEIRQLHESGWDIGSHTKSHANLPTTTNAALIDEVKGSKTTLERSLKIPISTFAYPRGKYNKSVVDVVKTSGYTIAFTMEDGAISRKTNPLLIPRIGVDRTHTGRIFTTIFSPSTIQFRALVKKTPIGKIL